MIQGLIVELSSEELHGLLLRQAELCEERAAVHGRRYADRMADSGASRLEKMFAAKDLEDARRYTVLAGFFKLAASRLVADETYRFDMKELKELYAERFEENSAKVKQ